MKTIRKYIHECVITKRTNNFLVRFLHYVSISSGDVMITRVGIIYYARDAGIVFSSMRSHGLLEVGSLANNENVMCFRRWSTFSLLCVHMFWCCNMIHLHCAIYQMSFKP